MAVTLPPSGLAQSPEATTLAPASVPSRMTTAPLRSQSDSPAVLRCQDTPGWRISAAYNGVDGYYFCSDPEVECYFKGTVVGSDSSARDDALASDHCCKCKTGCDGLCYVTFNEFLRNDEEEEEGSIEGTYVVIGAMVVVCCLTWCFVFMKTNQRANLRTTQIQQDLSSTRQTMSERRRQRLQSQLAGQTAPTITPPTALPVEDPTAARYEQILIKFYFQRVLTDKSRTALKIRALHSGEQETKPPDSSVRPDNSTTALEQTPTEKTPPDYKTQGESPSSRSVLSQRLSSRRKASSSDECCICLDEYHPGETICAPITDKCNHVFHEECVVEWLRNHDLCPLCRVNLME
eukprot:scaffold3107_cov126-Cylindrotheca_fusiformis.AAC.3